MNSATIFTAIGLLFAGATAYGLDQRNLLPVLGYQFKEVKDLAMTNKKRHDMEELLKKRRELRDLEKDLEEMQDAPKHWMELKEYLEIRIEELTKEINQV